MFALGFLGEPKPRSTAYGPAPLPGTYPPYKGAKGPKQRKCLKDGGIWAGETGKKWCQMPLSARPPGGETFFPPGTEVIPQMPVAPLPGGSIVTPPGGTDYVRPPVDTSQIPDYEDLPGQPIFDDIVSGIGEEDAAVRELQNGSPPRGGPVPGSMTIRPGTVGGGLGAVGTLALVIAGGAVIYFMVKAMKKRKTPS